MIDEPNSPARPAATVYDATIQPNCEVLISSFRMQLRAQAASRP